jgi:hypothetical protein
MKLMYAIIVATIVMPSPASAADRLTDRDLKQLVARIEQGRDRFDDALDDKLKHDVLRGASGEVNVDKFLNDFQESIDRLEQRLKPDYAASSEAAALLRDATAIDRFFRQQSAGTKGESEWNRLATDFKALAAAYGADFPLADNAAVRRIGDGEVVAAVEEVEDSADRIKKSLESDLKNDPKVDQPTREAIVDEAEALSKDAKTLRERVKDGKPSSAEADQLFIRADKLQAFIASHTVPASASAWPALSTSLQSIAGAYRVSWPAAR